MGTDCHGMGSSAERFTGSASCDVEFSKVNGCRFVDLISSTLHLSWPAERSLQMKSCVRGTHCGKLDKCSLNQTCRTASHLWFPQRWVVFALETTIVSVCK